MKISLPASDLAKRRLPLQRVFGPLTPKGRVQVFLRTTATGAVAGLGTDHSDQELRLARHSCWVTTVFLNYFEVWHSKERGRTFILNKAYFHLDAPLSRGQGDEEVLAVHCDPMITSGEVSFVYKRGPHMHVSGNKRDISKAHIALCLSNLEHTCSSFDAYWFAFEGILKMVNEEILPRLT